MASTSSMEGCPSLSRQESPRWREGRLGTRSSPATSCLALLIEGVSSFAAKESTRAMKRSGSTGLARN